MPRNLADRELVAAIVSGKRHLMGELYERYSTRIYHKCLTMVKNGDVAEDMAHDVFIKVFTSLNTYQGNADFSFWIYAITYNHCITYLKRSRRIFVDPIDGINDPVDEGEEQLSAKLLEEVRITQLDRLLRKLKPEEEIILTLKYLEGMSIRQMSTILELGESAVKMRLSRSRARLAELLKARNDE